MNVANSLAKFALNAEPHKDPALLEAAKTAVFDGAACMVGGTREEFGRILHDYAEGLATDRGASSIVASRIRTPPSAAAYINAAVGHSLCYDDTSNAMMGHPTIVVLPACLAVGEWLQSSGEELLDAYSVGVEVAVRVSETLAPHHYKKGWHATGITGGIGAAAACSRLMGLTAERCAAALNIAATSAQGLRANFGSMAMIYHAGLAARGGVDAAILASKGMTAAADAFSGAIGYFAMYQGNGDRGAIDEILDRIGQPFELASPGIDVKPYPCGSLGHRAIQGVIELRKEHGIQAENISQIVCRIPELHQQVLVNVRPSDLLESRISLVYPVSVAALNGSCGVGDFSYELLRSPAVLDLMEKIVVEGVPTEASTGAELFAASAEVIIKTKDGSVVTRQVTDVKGSPQYPLDDAEWNEKFNDCVVPSLGSTGAAELERQLHALDEMPNVSTLAELMATRKD